METTPATTHDVHLTEPIQEDLIARGLALNTMLVDGGYIEADLLVSSAERGIDLVGPAPANKTWQAKADDAFDHTQFAIDWESKVAICPAGQQSDLATSGRPGGERSIGSLPSICGVVEIVCFVPDVQRPRKVVAR